MKKIMVFFLIIQGLDFLTTWFSLNFISGVQEVNPFVGIFGWSFSIWYKAVYIIVCMAVFSLVERFNVNKGINASLKPFWLVTVLPTIAVIINSGLILIAIKNSL